MGSGHVENAVGSEDVQESTVAARREWGLGQGGCSGASCSVESTVWIDFAESAVGGFAVSQMGTVKAASSRIN